MIKLGGTIGKLKKLLDSEYPELYMVTDKEKYVREDGHGDYFSESWGSMIRSLGYKGIPNDIAKIHLEEAKEFKQIAFCGNIAGRSAGFHMMGGQGVVVKSSPKLAQPIKGSFSLISGILEGLLNDHPDQLMTFYGTLKQYLQALYTEQAMPILVTALCGPPGSGKSLTTDVILKNLVGGRIADPTPVLKGISDFNEEVIASELLVMGDKFSELKKSARKQLGNGLKEYVANGQRSLHAKHKSRVMAEPIQGVYITLNDEKEDIAILPPFGDLAVYEKINLFYCRFKPMPMVSDDPSSRKRFEKALLKELPALAYYILYQFEIPEYLKHPRYGVAAYHHPDIVELLEEMDDQSDIHFIIQQALFFGEKPLEFVTLPIGQIYIRLLEMMEKEQQHVFKSIAPTPRDLSYRLRELRKQHPDYYEKSKLSQQRVWTIKNANLND